MEYLMTYGWAFAIISVVLFALYLIGLFSGGSNISGTTCLSSSPFVCTSPILGTNGNVVFTFSQNSGASWYNIRFLCLSSTSPYSEGWTSAQGSNVGSLFTQLNSLTAAVYSGLSSSQSVIVGTITGNGVPCYGSSGPIGPQQVGAPFSGVLWINYTTNTNGAPGTPGTQWITVRVATLSLKVA